MKKLLLFASAAMIIFTSCMGQAKGKDQRKSPHDTVSNANVKVTYGRPYKKDRVVFGGLEKYGQVWRTGADEATQITFTKDGTFAGQPIKAGTYTLFTIPGEKEWTVILNSELGQWGSYGYDKVKDKDVLKATVPAAKTASPVEQLTISVPDNGLVIEWDNTSVTIPYSF
ncbi:MAG: DUF2911 domain-containing protein [Bacteroidota bacterium]